MTAIALISNNSKNSGIFINNHELPENYMCDFSIMGFVVDNYQRAFTLLLTAGYRMVKKKGGAEIHIDNPRHITEIQTLFAVNNIRGDFSDIADTLYQA